MRKVLGIHTYPREVKDNKASACTIKRSKEDFRINLLGMS